MKRTILTLTMVLASSICSQSFGFDLLDRMIGMSGSGHSASCCDTGCEPVCGAEAPCGGCGSSDCGGCGKGGLFGGPTCGLEDPCGGCGSCGDCMGDPTCGLEAACGACGSSGCNGGCFGDPTCGLEAACGGCDSCGGKGGGLLSRLFGGHGHGCDTGCGAPCEPTCGIGAGVAAPGMAVEAPACGCADPVCGCEAVGACGDACGNACDSACGGHFGNGGGLLSKLFGHRGHGCDSACDSGCGSCDGAYQGGTYQGGTYQGGTYQGGTVMPAPVDEQAAPMPPEPVVDPSASVTSKRRVIQASAVYVR